MANIPPPILLSAVICDRVIIDKMTGMPSLINIIQTLRAPKFPTRMRLLVFFCELTNGRGNASTKVRLIESQKKEKVMFEQKGSVKFQDIKQIVTMSLNMQGVVFPEPGEYRFQLFVDEELIGERRLQCKKTERKQGPPPKK